MGVLVFELFTFHASHDCLATFDESELLWTSPLKGESGFNAHSEK